MISPTPHSSSSALASTKLGTCRGRSRRGVRRATCRVSWRPRRSWSCGGWRRSSWWPPTAPRLCRCAAPASTPAAQPSRATDTYPLPLSFSACVQQWGDYIGAASPGVTFLSDYKGELSLALGALKEDAVFDRTSRFTLLVDDGEISGVFVPEDGDASSTYAPAVLAQLKA